MAMLLNSKKLPYQQHKPAAHGMSNPTSVKHQADLYAQLHGIMSDSSVSATPRRSNSAA